MTAAATFQAPDAPASGEAGRPAVEGEAATGRPVLCFIAHGNPIGQGRIRSLGKGRPSVHANAELLLPWRDTIGHAARSAIAGTDDPSIFPLDEPVAVWATFTVPKPLGAPKTRQSWPQKRPDGDHLLRACLDAMTHVVFVDDARCVELFAAKRYPLEGADALTYPGVVVRVYQLAESD